MPGTLHVVATPIGNLEDITLRAVRVLREAALIAAEDTRRSSKLLAHYAISTPTVSYHEHNSRTRLPSLIRRLAGGDDVALVTDAGTPGISDPGMELVGACIDRQIPVNPVPGVSAPLTAAIVSGFPLIPFTIFGFPPHRSKARADWLEALSEIPHTFSFFEAPHRIEQTLASAAAVLGERPMVVAREVTKVHQEFLRGAASEITRMIPKPKGEFTVVVGPKAAAGVRDEPIADVDLAAEFWQITDAAPSLTRREAIAAVARRTGRTARDVYAAVERAKLVADDQ